MITAYLLGFLALLGLLVWFLSRVVASEDTAAASPVLAVNHLISGDSEQALEELRRWYEFSGQDVMVGLALGNVLRHAGKLEIALRTHKSLALRMGLNPLQARLIHTELAADYLALGQPASAESALELAAKAGELDEAGLLLAERIHTTAQNWEEAAKALQSFGRKTGQDIHHRLALLHYAEGMVLWASQAEGDAFALFKKATTVDPDCLPAWLGLARFHRHNGRPEKARKLLEKHAETFAQKPELRLEALAEAAKAMEKPEVFLTTAREHLDQFPNDWRSRAVLAAFLSECGDVDEAAMELLICLNDKPGVVLLHREYLKLLSRCPSEELRHRFEIYHQRLQERSTLDAVWSCGACAHVTATYHWTCPACRQPYTCEPREL